MVPERSGTESDSTNVNSTKGIQKICTLYIFTGKSGAKPTLVDTPGRRRAKPNENNLSPEGQVDPILIYQN